MGPDDAPVGDGIDARAIYKRSFEIDECDT